MIKMEKDLNTDQKVSSQLALIFILLLSVVVAWYTVNTGEKISKNAQNTIKAEMDRRVNFLPAPVPLSPNRN
jgi:hypothetical protein